MPRRLYIFGAGGHGREIAWLARSVFPGVEILHVVDAARHLTSPINGADVRLLDTIEPTPDDGFITAVGDAGLRMRAADRMHQTGLSPVTLVHPSAVLAPTVRIGAGSVVCAGVVLTDNVLVGEHAVVNIGCTLSHDVRIEDYATLSPGVHIAGHVVVRRAAMLGVGSSVINGTAAQPIVIGVGATVGAGAAVIDDVADGVVVAGVPARPLHRGGDR